MSDKKKPKKLRRPNLAAAGLLRVAQGQGGGAEMGGPALRSTPAGNDPHRAEFDYTYVRQDLRRILILAGSLVVVIVALSFVLR